MKTIFKQVTAEVKSLGENMLEAVVASNSLDRHGEILNMEGLDLKAYKENPVVLWAHNSSLPPIAKAESIRKKDGKLIAKMKFAVEESDFAREIYRLFKGGYMKAFSIGFIPKEMEENQFMKSEMIEFSAVPIPANPEALALAKSKGIDVDMVMKEFKNNEIEEVKTSLEELKKITLGIESVIGSLTTDATGRKAQTKIKLIKARRAVKLADKYVEGLNVSLKERLKSYGK